MSVAPVAALELKTVSGIPLHPLIVHVPVVLVPLALIGAVLALVRPPWRSWSLPVVAVLVGASVVGVQLAVMSGEGLEEINGEKEALIERHAQLAEQARPMVFVFFLVAAATALAWWLVQRGGADGADEPTRTRAATAARLLVPLCALSVLTGALATVWVYRTGHTGAESVWKGDGEKGERDEGGEVRPGDDEAPAIPSQSRDGDTDGD
ncbi:MAG: DUF2231 domain-containing protein [Acidimicrobiales bacterium]